MLYIVGQRSWAKRAAPRASSARRIGVIARRPCRVRVGERPCRRHEPCCVPCN